MGHWYSFPSSLLPHYLSSLSASFSLSTGPSLEQKPQGGSGFVSSWSPQITPTVETPSPSSISPASALVLCGPPPPSQPHISQTALVSPSDQDAGTESKRNSDPCCSCLSRISIKTEWLNSRYTSTHLPLLAVFMKTAKCLIAWVLCWCGGIWTSTFRLLYIIFSMFSFILEFRRQLSTLSEEDNQCTTTTSEWEYKMQCSGVINTYIQWLHG